MNEDLKLGELRCYACKHKIGKEMELELVDSEFVYYHPKCLRDKKEQSLEDSNYNAPGPRAL